MRYLRPSFAFTSISTFLSVLGPVIGVAVLITVQSVMNGFHEKIRDTFLSMNSHITVRAFDGVIQEPLILSEQLEALGYEASPVVELDTLIQTRSMKKDILPKRMIGIDPETIESPSCAHKLDLGTVAGVACRASVDFDV